MKKYFLLISMLLFMGASFAQPGKKPPVKEKPPTQKKVNELEELQKEMDELSPEEKKEMEKMGLKMPDMKNNGISDAQLKKAYEDDNRIVPIKDVARIAAIPKTLTDKRMGAYITSIQKKAAVLLKPIVKNMADKIYSYIKSNSKNSSEAGKMAIGLFMAGKPEMAYYTLGKICADNPADTDNLSNYASMLSMLGAQHLAIPVLNNLNAKFPKNSTLLNNLGQAWFGLGETDKAEKYFDSTIRIYAQHAQANLTQSLIHESKGDKAHAVEAVRRSIKEAYSMEKADRLEKLGHKLKSADLSWDRPMPKDALGLEKFNWPDYPMNVEQSGVLEKQWNAFIESCEKEIDGLEVQQASLEKIMNEASQQRTQELLHAGMKGSMVDPFPRFAHKAFVKLAYLVDGKDEQLANNYQKKVAALAEAYTNAEALEEKLDKELKLIKEKYEDQFGEGKENPFDAACADDTKAKDAYLGSANKLLEENSTDFLNFLSRKINDEIYYYQYTMWPEQFEWAKIHAQISWISWLSQLQRQYVKFKNKSYWCQNKEGEDVTNTFKLQAFDDVACQYKSSMDLKIIKFTNNCSRMTSEFDFLFLGYVRKDDFERAEGDTYISSTVKISAEAGVDKALGPLKVEAKIGGGIEVEIGRTGIENIVLIGEVKAGIGTNVLDENEKTGTTGIGIAGKDAFPTTVEVGVEGRISIISGKGSVSGTGILKDIKMAEW